MAVTAQKLLEQFRREVDDLPPNFDAADPSAYDDSDCVWSDKDVYVCMSRAQRMFVRETEYIVSDVYCTVRANDPKIPLPEHLVRPVDQYSYYLQVAKKTLRELNEAELNGLHDDYGVVVSHKSWREQDTGSPQYISLDVMTDWARISPTSEIDDTLVIRGYIQTGAIDPECPVLTVTNFEHTYGLLHGMKMFAYDYHDTDAYDPKLSTKYEAKFRQLIGEVYAERRARRKKPTAVAYGGF